MNLKIAENVYVLESTKGSYVYLIKRDNESILIDTGEPGKGKNILKEFGSLNIKSKDIKHILLTHHDVDHVGNAALLQKETKATLWASQEDIPYILGYKSRPGIKRFVSILMRAEKPGKIEAYNKQKVDDIEVIQTPGHTPGHVSFLYNDILFAGDLVRNDKGQLTRFPSFGTWDGNIVEQSINKMDDYSFNWVCPAHGEPLQIDGKLKQFIK